MIIISHRDKFFAVSGNYPQYVWTIEFGEQKILEMDGGSLVNGLLFLLPHSEQGNRWRISVSLKRKETENDVLEANERKNPIPPDE